MRKHQRVILDRGCVELVDRAPMIYICLQMRTTSSTTE